ICGLPGFWFLSLGPPTRHISCRLERGFSAPVKRYHGYLIRSRLLRQSRRAGGTTAGSPPPKPLTVFDPVAVSVGDDQFPRRSDHGSTCRRQADRFAKGGAPKKVD